jgi:predicted nucleic acid-binding protein
MANQLVYVETTIVSYLAGRESRDTLLAAHQEITTRWWRERGPLFTLVVSELVHEEASAGDPGAAQRRLALLSGLQVLPVSEEAVRLAGQLVAEGPIPRESDADALHIAVAALAGVDYLLTWNCKHLANAALRYRIESLVEENGYECPIICTPEELMED